MMVMAMTMRMVVIVGMSMVMRVLVVMRMNMVMRVFMIMGMNMVVRVLVVMGMNMVVRVLVVVEMLMEGHILALLLFSVNRDGHMSALDAALFSGLGRKFHTGDFQIVHPPDKTFRIGVEFQQRRREHITRSTHITFQI